MLHQAQLLVVATIFLLEASRLNFPGQVFSKSKKDEARQHQDSLRERFKRKRRSAVENKALAAEQTAGSLLILRVTA